MYLPSPPMYLQVVSILILTAGKFGMDLLAWYIRSPRYRWQGVTFRMMWQNEVLTILTLIFVGVPIVAGVWNHILAPAFSLPKIRLSHAAVLVSVVLLYVACIVD